MRLCGAFAAESKIDALVVIVANVALTVLPPLERRKVESQRECDRRVALPLQRVRVQLDRVEAE